MNFEKGNKPIEVLIIEDNQEDLLLAKRMLERTTYTSFHVSCADSLSKGIEYAVGGTIDVILSDLNLPDSPRDVTFSRLKLQVPEIPIVVLSGFADENASVKAVSEGAQDYLIKGQIDSNLLVRSLRYAIERKKAEDMIEKLAYHDSLTGLPCRKLFSDRGIMAMAESKRNHGKIAMIMLDLDNFKAINDNLGHDAGDELLKEVGSRLAGILRQTDTVCRMGGDEFGLLISDLTLRETIKEVAQRILDAIRKPFDLHGFKEKVTASLGIAIYPEDGENLEMLIKHADIAMYEVKKSGCDNYLYFQPSMKATTKPI